MTAEWAVVPSSPRKTSTSAGLRLRTSSFTTSRFLLRGSKNQVPMYHAAVDGRAAPRYRARALFRSRPPARATEVSTYHTNPEQSTPRRPTL